ncbi:MAG: glutamyl-tRNA reductase [Candidatus Sericytochromatia bacterium]|nr:glutamyl-tRNA reductase [Candidatus Tanganyikabacteria bacterium]
MHVVELGLNHELAPVALRERVAISGTRVPEALADLLATGKVTEVAILSTCNRTEIYATTEEPEEARGAISEWLAARGGLRRDELSGAFGWRADQDAVTHLFRVAAGLESQILGEGQILGQVREAARLAREAGSLGPILDALFRQVVSAGKRVRSETDISQGAVSVGSAAVELAHDALSGLDGRSVLLIGSGKLGELALKHLAAQGVRRIVVANRTLESAQELANVVGGEAVPFYGMKQSLQDVDVVLCCTGAPHYVLGVPDFEAVMADREGRPIVVVDVSVPRNIDPAVTSLAGVRLFDIDHLAAVADRNREDRAFLVPQVEAVLAAEMVGWEKFIRSYEAAPTITGLRQKIETLRLQEFETFASRHPDLGPEHLAAIEHLTRALANKFLHDPTVGLRNRGDSGQGVHAAAIRELFRLNPRGSGLAAKAR